MNERKSVFKGVRMTPRADKLIENICHVCNVHRLRINGDDEVNASILLSHIFEEVTNSKNPQERLSQILQKLYKVRESTGETLDQNRVSLLAQEILNVQ